MRAEAVNEVLEQRAHDPRGLNRTMTVSFAVHVGLVALALILPRGWLFAQHEEPKMMTISLGVSAGERSTGMTAIGNRPIEEVAPPPKKGEAIKSTPPKSDMSMSASKTKFDPARPFEAPLTAPTPPRPPATGAQVRAGSTVAETGGAGTSPGLTFGGGAGAPQLTLAPDFCCMAYAEQILSIISRNWQRNQTDKGTVVIQFNIMRDGTVTAKSYEKNSGSGLLDRVSRMAIPDQLLPLPAEYKQDKLTIHLTFPYGGL